MTEPLNFQAMLPELILMIGAMALLMLGVFAKRERGEMILWLSLGLLALALLAQASAFATGTGTLVLKTATGDHNFNIEVATTRAEQALGLMFRRSLPENAGMLFIYEQPQPAA